MPNSPILWGPNSTAINLQNQTLQASGELIANDGPKNLIKYNRFENGLTTGWGLGTTGTLTNGLPTGSPTFGSGASGNLSIAAVSTTPISGNFSLSYISSAATTAGNMLHTDALIVQPDLQAKVLTFKFNYQAFANASNGNFSGTSSNSFGVAVWDVTNSSWLIPAGAFAMTQNSGVGVATGTFQTNANTASIRFVIYNANATAGAITMYFDDFSLGPQTAPIGPVIYNQASTIDVTGTLSASTKVTAAFTSSTNTGVYSYSSGTYTMLKDAYVSIDATMRVGSTQVQPSIVIEGTTVFADFVATVSAFASASWRGFLAAGATFHVSNSSGAGSADIYRVYVSATAYASGVVSNDTDTRVVSFVGSGAGGAITANTTNIPATAAKDTHGAWTGSTYVVPVSGDYSVGGTIVGPSISTIATYVNGSISQTLGTIPASNVTGTLSTVLPNLKAGDIISVRGDVSQTLSAVRFTIFRLSGPSVIAASESVTGRYVSCASSINGSFSDLTYTTKDWDSHNAYSGATWTCPVSGKYTFTARMVTSAASAHIAFVQILKNGVAVTSTSQPSNASGVFTDVQIIDDISCLAGDTIKIQGGDTGTTPSIQTSAIRNTFSWKRVGN